MNSVTPSTKEKQAFVELVMLGTIVALVVGAALLIYSYRQSISNSIAEFGHRPLAVATHPTGANIYLDGKWIGESPLTVETSIGPHTLTAKKDGFSISSSAIELAADRYDRRGADRILSDKAPPWAVNLELQPLAEQDGRNPGSKTELQNPSSRAANVKSLDQLALETRLANLERETARAIEEVRELRGVWLQFLSISAASLIALLGITITIIINRPKQ